MPAVCLVLDMRNPAPGASSESDQAGQWYVWQMPRNAAGAAMHAGILHWVDADGNVRFEVPGQFFDDTNTQILPRRRFAPLSLAQLQGVEKVFRVQVDGTGNGASVELVTAKLTVSDYANPTAWTAATLTGPSEVELRPSPTRVTAVEVAIEEQASAALVEGYKLRAMSLEVGVSGRMRRLDVSQKVTG